MSIRADGETFEAFISYRRKDDEELILSLRDKIGIECSRRALDPPKLFVDADAIKPGDEWMSVFGRSLTKSGFFCPVFGMSVDGKKGSLSQLFNLGGDHDKCDNLLLEMELALCLTQTEPRMVQTILPIMYGSSHDSRGYLPFSWQQVENLPDRTSPATKAVLMEFLGQLNIEPSNMDVVRNRTIRQTVQSILAFQGIVLDQLGSRELAKTSAAFKFVDLLVELRMSAGMDKAKEVPEDDDGEGMIVMTEAEDGIEGLLAYMEKFEQVYYISGHGAKNKIDQPEMLYEIMNGVVASIEAPRPAQKPRWLAIYGGDPYDSDTPDIAAVVRFLNKRFGVTVLAVQCDAYQDYMVADQDTPTYDFVTAAFFYNTDYSESHSIMYGGFHPSDTHLKMDQRRLVGQSRICLHPSVLANPVVRGYIAVGGGNITLQDLQICVERSFQVMYVPMRCRDLVVGTTDEEERMFGQATTWMKRNYFQPWVWNKGMPAVKAKPCCTIL